MEGRDSQGEKTNSSFGSEDLMVSMSASRKLGSSLRLGVTGKAINSRIAGYKAGQSLAADMGLTYSLNRFPVPLTMGFSLNNLGQEVRFISQGDPLPTSLNMGASMTFGPATTLLGANRLIKDGSTNLSLGVEFGAGPVSLRGGFQTQSSPGSSIADQSGAHRFLQGLSTGLGLRFSMWRLDYAISQQAQELGANHRLALSFQWGSPTGKINKLVRTPEDEIQKALAENKKMGKPGPEQKNPSKTNRRQIKSMRAVK
jgi:hypothetical protein